MHTTTPRGVATTTATEGDTVNVLEQLRDRVAGRKRTAEETILAAAHRAANGESVDVDSLDTALAACGHTPDSFATLVELMHKRRKWRADMDRGAKAAAEVEKHTAAGNQLQAEREEWLAAWHQRATANDTARNAATALADRARDARNALWHPDNVPGPVAERVRAAEEAHHDAQVEVARIERERREAEDLERHHRGWETNKRELNKSTPEGDADDHKRRADRAARRVAELDTELAAATKALATAATELDAARAAALKV